jgi:hypothetical protein
MLKVLVRIENNEVRAKGQSKDEGGGQDKKNNLSLEENNNNGYNRT